MRAAWSRQRPTSCSLRAPSSPASPRWKPAHQSCATQDGANGITRARLPRDNEVICTLDDPSVPALAAKLGTTRTAAAMELWRDKLAGAVVAIGNAPTALFRLLELLDEGVPQPACIIGMPVGFVGAAEAKASADRPTGASRIFASAGAKAAAP